MMPGDLHRHKLKDIIVTDLSCHRVHINLVVFIGFIVSCCIKLHYHRNLLGNYTPLTGLIKFTVLMRAAVKSVK